MRYLDPATRSLVERGEVLELVLVDNEGMVLDSQGTLFPPEQLAALFSPLHRLLDNIRTSAKIGSVEELSIRTLDPRLRIIVQPFSVQGISFLLIALFPITTFYRQVTADILRIVKDCIRKLSAAHPEGAEGLAPKADPERS